MGIMTLTKVRKLKRWGSYDINKAWEHLEKCGRFTDFRERVGPYKDIKNIWQGKPCYVVGGSIAARGFNLKKLDNKNSIGCNHMIDYYDGFSWFLFMDSRFVRINKYPLHKFKGKIFALNSAKIFREMHPDLVFFKSKSIQRAPEDIIENGLYCRSLAGMNILNLAIISGANPIYMLGLDCPKDIDFKEGLHYELNYTGEGDVNRSHAGVTKLLPYFDKFRPWRARIINVCENGYIDTFKKISLKEFEENCI